MVPQADRICITMQQMERMLRALDSLMDEVLPKNPALFAALAESPLEELERLRKEVAGFIGELRPTA